MIVPQHVNGIGNLAGHFLRVSVDQPQAGFGHVFHRRNTLLRRLSCHQLVVQHPGSCHQARRDNVNTDMVLVNLRRQTRGKTLERGFAQTINRTSSTTRGPVGMQCGME